MVNDERVWYKTAVFSVQRNWLRVTQNPKVDGYPETGDIITLKNHKMLPDGDYLVIMVEEYEPGYTKDKNGRDIRINLIDSHGETFGWNGENIKEAIINVTKYRRYTY